MKFIKIHMSRMTGQTTRLVDKAVQDIFTTNTKWTAQDHYEAEGSAKRTANRLLFTRVVTRLLTEHKNNVFVFNEVNLTIEKIK